MHITKNTKIVDLVPDGEFCSQIGHVPIEEAVVCFFLECAAGKCMLTHTRLSAPAGSGKFKKCDFCLSLKR